MDYRPVEKWGALPDGMSFVEATSVAVDANDDVYVFNRGKHPVIVFDRSGGFKRTWGEGVFRRAHGITVGPILLGAKVGYHFNATWTLSAEVLNVLDRRDHDIDYAYESRVRPGDTPSTQIHFHPVEPIQARFALTARF